MNMRSAGDQRVLGHDTESTTPHYTLSNRVFSFWWEKVEKYDPSSEICVTGPCLHIKQCKAINNLKNFMYSI